MDVAALLTPQALAELPPDRQLAAWCAAHGLTMARLAAELEVDPAQLSRVARGIDAGAPVVAAVLKRTGVKL